MEPVVPTGQLFNFQELFKLVGITLVAWSQGFSSLWWTPTATQKPGVENLPADHSLLDNQVEV